MCQYSNKNIKQLEKEGKAQCHQLGKSTYFNNPVSQDISRRTFCPSRQPKGSQGMKKRPVEVGKNQALELQFSARHENGQGPGY